jgi:hypothetical protein
MLLRLASSWPLVGDVAQGGEDGQHAPVVVRCVVESELGEDVGDVALDGLTGDYEPVGDRGVGPAFGDESEHLPFPLGQGEQRVGT